MVKNAKEVFAESLKRMLESKRLDHIMVKDLVEDCGLSRQAFYYHFNDSYDLVEWIFLEEAKKVLADNRDIDTWQQGLYNVLEWIRDNKSFVVNTYRSMSHEYLEAFMYKVLYSLIYPVIEKQGVGKNIEDKNIVFISHFYSLAVTALGLDWVRTGMREDPKEIVEQVVMLARGDLVRALQIPPHESTLIVKTEKAIHRG